MKRDAQVSILLVDDRPENLLALEGVLAELGQNLVTASSGREALKRVLEQEFAIILLDVQMPGMDGFETAAAIRTRDQSRYTPIIFLTAISKSEEHMARGYAHGAVDYVFKPFVPETLRTKVATFVELRKKTDALEEEVRRRRQAEEELRELSRGLERRVEERTADLARTNRELALANETAEAALRRLRELEALRDDMMHMIVHDLRTPLTSLLTGLQTLEYLGPLNEEQQEFLAIADRGGHLLLGIINDLLDVGKMVAGSLRLERRPLSPAALVEQAVAQVGILAREKRLTLRQEIDPGLPSLHGDEEKLCRTLVNLLGNAVKFTPPGGTVTVTAGLEPRSDAFRFSVRDTGEGIPPEAFGLIFEKFGQVENRKAGHKMSTGLGLTFCKLAVEAHCGQIWVESELGKGSTFLFTIPAASVPPPLAPPGELIAGRMMVADEEEAWDRVLTAHSTPA